MKSVLALTVCGLVGLAVIVGCSGTSSKPDAASRPSPEGEKFIAKSEPQQALAVKEVRANAKDNDEVVILGRIGGSEKPFVEETAAFTIVDASLVPCNERPGDGCTTPWDYCCDLNDLPTHMAMVKFVDEQGNALAVDAKKLLGVKELQTVVIRGQAKRTGDNLVVLAKELYVRK